MVFKVLLIQEAEKKVNALLNYGGIHHKTAGYPHRERCGVNAERGVRLVNSIHD